MNSLDKTLELFAAGEPSAEIVDAAQRRLDAAIARTSAVARPARRVGGWLAAATSAAVVALAMLWLPLNPSAAQAFAQVQQHFRDFRTMRFDIEQRMNGKVMMKSRVSVTRDGNVRTDVGNDISVIVNSAERRVMTLMHPARVAMETPLRAPATSDDALGWLEDIRNFQGKAKQLSHTRVIDGHKAYGWELPIGGGSIVLWATDDGQPLEMIMGGSTPVQLDFHFEFEPQLPADWFSTAVPAGYSRAEAED
jgi:hypothetical protein